MIDFSKCREEELWKFVATHLAKNGIEAVLVGGAVVSIYSKGAYQSGDLDFVITNLIKNKVDSLMEEIGFKRHGRHFIHPECKHLFVEFPTGPISIGDDYSIKLEELEEKGQKIKILSPTDCIKDRLASYIYFKAYETLDQAILVAQQQPFKIKEVEKWCKNEGAMWAYKDFVNKLKKK